MTTPASTDPIMLSVFARRLDGIVREMSNTLLRAGRSAVISTGRDFSCSIVTADDRLLAAAEGLPVHVFGSHLQTREMSRLHPDLAPGDAFLHNDPYLGNTHPADHTILVPVFQDGTHLLTACVKAHQADIGNSAPTTYMPFARDVYEEGALIFPCVRIQHGYRDIDDIVRMCMQRIRVPDQWYGDYLAALGAARVAEQRLGGLVGRYGVDEFLGLARDWLDYSERRMVAAVRKLPSCSLASEETSDPLPGLPNGITLRARIAVDSDEALITVDLRDNPESVPLGVNISHACAVNNAMHGVFNVLGPDVPHNAGSFRRIRVLLAENSVVGAPVFPHSCSVATTNLADRLVNLTQLAFAGIGDGFGLAEGGMAMGLGFAVISGDDLRRAGAPFINQLILGNNGGPASPDADGWVTWALPVGAGLTYRDSIEVDEQKYPIHFRSLRLVPDSGGAGRLRGAPTAALEYGPRHGAMTVTFPLDGRVHPPRGVLGGASGAPARVEKLDRAGRSHPVEPGRLELLEPGEWLRGNDCGGGGYGDPLRRDPERVRADVLEGWVSIEAARDTYGVVLAGRVEDESLTVLQPETDALRALSAGTPSRSTRPRCTPSGRRR